MVSVCAPACTTAAPARAGAANVVQDEHNNAAVASAAAMARAVIAAELYRTTGELPSFAATNREDT